MISWNGRCASPTRPPCVVLTANHYWLDGLVGSAIVVAALWVASRAPSLDGREPGRPGARTRASGHVGAAR